MDTMRLSCSTFWVDVRLREITGAGSPLPILQTDQASEWAIGAVEAIELALAPFAGIVDELLASLAENLG